VVRSGDTEAVGLPLRLAAAVKVVRSGSTVAVGWIVGTAVVATGVDGLGLGPPAAGGVEVGVTVAVIVGVTVGVTVGDETPAGAQTWGESAWKAHGPREYRFRNDASNGVSGAVSSGGWAGACPIAA
jgi:hypothetical protein